MAFDETLASRVRALLEEEEGVSERRMFGGLAFMLRGHMFCGVVGDELMVRIGADAAEAALERPHVRRMDFTGRPLEGMVFVTSPGLRSAAALRRWVEHAADFARALPPK